MHTVLQVQVRLIPCLVINKYTDWSNFLVYSLVCWRLKTFSIEYKKMKTTNMMFLLHTSKYITRWSGIYLSLHQGIWILETIPKRELLLLVWLSSKHNQQNKLWTCFSWVTEEEPHKLRMPIKHLQEVMQCSKSALTKYQKQKTPKCKLYWENFL